MAVCRYAKDASIEEFGRELTTQGAVLDGVVLMPPQLPRSNDPLPSNDTWREAFQNSFIGPLALLKEAMAHMLPDPANGRRSKVVIISAISSAQVIGNYALSNAYRAAWAAEGEDARLRLGSASHPHQHTISRLDPHASLHEID